jgi:potassium uptake TrkH family protein
MARRLRHPARLLPIAFLLAIGTGTALLMLPPARRGPGSAEPVVALFTATSAVSVTGLAVVDTATYWTPFGQGVILLLAQAGGFGIMTLATLLGLIVSRRLGLSQALVAQAEIRALDLGTIRGLLRRVALTVLVIELVTAVILGVRLYTAYDYEPLRAVWHGLFHGVSAFNNAGFALYSDGLVGFASDPWISGTIAVSVLLGSLGFPVLFEVGRGVRRPSRWSVHVKMTVYGSLLLLAVGFLAVLVLEWSNPRTLGPLSAPGKLLASFFHGVMPRSGGLNTLDVGAMRSETLGITDILMFIGGGSAGTAGGIKVSTFFLLAFVIWAEVRGERDVVAFGRRMETGAQRQALTVALLGVAVVAGGTLAMLMLTDEGLERVLFEVISASATVGLSTGITPNLPPTAQLLLVLLMYLGRVGTVTVATALALRERRRLFRLPEERPVVG